MTLNFLYIMNIYIKVLLIIISLFVSFYVLFIAYSMFAIN